jgi:hypothetical protein
MLSLFSAQAGDPIKWSKGSVVEKDGQVRIGEISFQTIDLILFRADDKVMVYTPHHVKAFFYYDEDENVNRKFNSLKVDENQLPLFYEYVVWGKVQMVRLVKNKNLIKGKLRDTFDYNYLVSWNDSYSRIRDFKHSVLPSLVEESAIFEQLIHEQKLNPSSIIDVVSILKLYNKVINSSEEIVARND